jgi:hypothetical protein
MSDGRWHPYRRVPAALSACLLLAGVGDTLAAQVVRGEVRLAADRAADVGVILVDTAGAVVAGALTDSTGRYVLRAPAEGSYRVRVRRIGFAPDSSTLLRLAGVEPATFDARLTPRVLTLSTVAVSEARQCVVPREADELTSGLWQEVQNALAAAIATTGSARLGFTLRRFERQLDSTGSRVMRSKQWEVRTVASEPYVSIAAESLAAQGFVRDEGRYTVYAVPDARTLSSGAFARTHCLRATRDRARPAFIGLEFAPVGRDRDGEVRGTLWVDRASSELRTLEYRYTGRRSERPAQGRLEYRRLPGGAWIVGAWVVRVPVLARVSRTVPGIGEGMAGTARLRDTTVEETVAVWEVGGDVSDSFDPGDAVGAADGAGAVHGSIVDSATSQGMPEVLVELRPAAAGPAARRYGATTGADGRFAFDGVRRGEYLLTVTAARLDTANTGVRPIALSVGAAARIGVRITIPPAAQGIASLCESAPPAGTTVLHGIVHDAAGHAPSNARVSAEWPTGPTTKARMQSAAVERHVAFADSAGRYALCGLPGDRALLVRASAGALQSRPISLEPSGAPVRYQTITLEVRR